jgi:hypothetical protein
MTAWHISAVLVKLRRSTSSISSSVRSPSAARRTMPPALLMRMSTRPSPKRRASFTSRSRSAFLVTSADTAIARRPSATISRAVASASARLAL